MEESMEKEGLDYWTRKYVNAKTVEEANKANWEMTKILMKKEKRTPEERTTPEAWQIIEHSCKPYGGFVALINKCGGTLISQVWIRSMEEYAELARKEEQEKLNSRIESMVEEIKGTEKDLDFKIYSIGALKVFQGSFLKLDKGGEGNE